MSARTYLQWTDPAAVAVLAALAVDDLEAWRDRARCAEADPDAFFPEKGGSTREAKKVCVACPVRAECLEYALEHDERFGIWGGLSEQERRTITRLRHAEPQEAVTAKACSKCKVVKPLTDFAPRGADRTDWQSRCKSCTTDNLRAWRHRKAQEKAA